MIGQEMCGSQTSTENFQRGRPSWCLWEVWVSHSCECVRVERGSPGSAASRVVRIAMMNAKAKTTRTMHYLILLSMCGFCVGAYLCAFVYGNATCVLADNWVNLLKFFKLIFLRTSPRGKKELFFSPWPRLRISPDLTRSVFILFLRYLIYKKKLFEHARLLRWSLVRIDVYLCTDSLCTHEQ